MITIATHSGSFHADDVFSIAAFQLLFGEDNVRVTRTRDQALIEAADYVVDVGDIYDHEAKRYDHHQNGAPVRDNGIPYAAFGLMWQHYGEEICQSKQVAEKIEENLAQQIDAADNGIKITKPVYEGIDQISFDAFVKTWMSLRGTQEDMDQQFMTVVSVMRAYLERRIEIERNKLQMSELAIQAYNNTEDKSIVVSDEAISRNAFIELDTKVVVLPDDNAEQSNWLAIAVPKAKDTYETKVRFPEAWAGLRGEELERVSGITSMNFCHKNLYLVVAGSKESAIAAARVAVRTVE